DQVAAGITDMSTAHLSMKIAGGPIGMAAEGDVDASATPPEAAMTVNYPSVGGEVGVRTVDGDMYLQGPMLTSDKWVKVPVSTEDLPLSGYLLDQLDPSKALGAMADYIDEVTYVGDEDVNGETLHHYKVTVSSDAMQKLDDELAAANAPVQLP